MAKKEIRVPNIPHVYRIVDVHKNGREVATNLFRVRKRVKIDGTWTTHTKTFENLAEAKAFARTDYTPEQKEPDEAIHFEEVFERLLVYLKTVKRTRAATTDLYKVRRKHLDFFNGMSMKQINAKVVDAWLNLLYDPEYLETQQASRINYEKEYSILSSLFRYYRNHEDDTFISPLLDRHRERAFARSKDQKLEIRYMSASEEGSFMAALKEHDPYEDLALFQLHTGCRISEAAALEFRNISFLKNEVTICQHLYWERKRNGAIHLIPGTKSGPHRLIPLSEECRAMLKRRFNHHASEKVFPWERDGDWLPYRCVQAAYNRAFKSAGIDKSSTHVLRHTFAVRFLEQVRDIYALQKVLGHTDLKVTQVYAKYSNDSVRKAFQLFRGGKEANNEALVPQLVPRAQK